MTGKNGCNKWVVPQSMLVGAVALFASMIVPDIRNLVVKGASKISSYVGL